MQCWGCGGNHMRIDFPEKSDKVRIAHNVQQAVKIEDMAINVLRIYTPLDNK
jgi:hypothetical protein